MADATQWFDQLKLGDPAARAEAAEQLSRMGAEAQPVIPQLVHGAGDQDEAVREWCIAALEEVGPPAACQIADLTALAQAADATVAYWAITLIGRAGVQGAPALAVLIDRLAEGNDESVRQRAAWALAAVGRDNSRATAALEAAAAGNGATAAHARLALDRLTAA